MSTHATTDLTVTVRARTLLTRDLATLADTATLAEAEALMRHLEVRHLPVLGPEGLLGLVHLDDVSSAGPDASSRTVLAATRPVPVLYPDDDLARVVAVVADSASGAAVVLDRSGRLLGLVTDSDLPPARSGSSAAGDLPALVGRP